jgi:hypothetical protein
MSRNHCTGQGLSTLQFCEHNNRCMKGLISTARSFANTFATDMPIETADGVLSGTHSYEQLIASNEVAGATAQLVGVLAKDRVGRLGSTSDSS